MFGLRENRPRLSRMDSLKAKPLRAPMAMWREEADGRVAVSVPRRNDWFGKLVSSILIAPEQKTVELDEIGSYIWKRMDGRTTIRQLVDALSSEYGIHRKEAEGALAEYLKMLSRRGMIAMAVNPGG